MRKALKRLTKTEAEEAQEARAALKHMPKQAGSRLREAVKITHRDLIPGSSAMRNFTMHHGGKEVGFLDTMHGQIVNTQIKPEYRGLGLGKKLYGEAMRRLPNQELRSGGQVTDKAQRVWHSLEKSPSYKITKTPGTVTQRGDRQVLETDLKNPKPLFTGQLPAKAAVKS